MVAPKIQILMTIGVALGVVQAGPISIRADKPSFDNKVLFCVFRLYWYLFFFSCRLECDIFISLTPFSPSFVLPPH